MRSGFALSLLCAVLSTGLAPSLTAEERVITDDQGRIITVPLDTPAHLRNPWPAAMEERFRTRRSAFIKQYAGKVGVNTAIENEKGTYPPTILAFCAGDREAAIDALQTPDAQAAWYAHTKGIDYYWCFTLKGQMRKYFFLGQYLDPAYRQQMFDGGAAWVATDPRPNTELVLLTDAADPAVATYARDAMSRIWRDEAGLEQLAAAAMAEYEANPKAHQAHLKKAFADFIRAHKAELGGTRPTTPAQWIAWWNTLCAGDWMVFEEYDRRTNLRPHPQFGIGTGPVGSDWSPRTRGGVIDWRNTDNLRGMREVAVYLMAEETGSERVRKIFKERIRLTARNFLTIGNGEWDSPTYLSHTASGYVNLYDFAKDEEVRLLAKGILDFIHTAAAIKYFNGMFNGPNCRDYGTTGGHIPPALMMHFWVDQHDTTPPENDIAHFATSAYRPPAAVVALARKELAKPVELFASHPHYQNFIPANQSAPQYHETTYIAQHYQMGSLREGGGYDVNGGKILIDDGEGGADYFIPSTQAKGSICRNPARSDRIAQNANLWLCLSQPKVNKRGAKTTSINMLLPEATTVEQEGGVTFLTFRTCYAALRGINATITGIDPKMAKRFMNKKKSRVPPGPILSGAGAAPGALAGYVIEMGEDASHGSYAAFKQAVLAKSTLAYADGTATYTGAKGRSVALQYGSAATARIWRDGEEHTRDRHRALWQDADGTPGPVSLGWKEGVLHVAAGGHTFTGTFDLETGTYRFTQTLAQTDAR